MFAVGQRVWRRAGARSGTVSGTVLECYGDQVCVRQDNGAETDFPVAELTERRRRGTAVRRPGRGTQGGWPGRRGARCRFGR